MLETLIDTEDLPNIVALSSSWHVVKKPHGNLVRGTSIEGKKVFLHRLITGAPDGLLVDHINHNPLDNRKCNLRLVTPAQNAQNRLKPDGVSGVHYDPNKDRWAVRISINGQRKRIGRYESKEVAEKAGIEARAELLPYSQEALQKKKAAR